ncbi:RcpC/CpaB family pilus assembly protein [Streptomyces sp. NPDC006798]|uniref:RcpC/CpaB family pilus assembly protein n=1 Tax=Streptomyces sp. NPDC006798 TaxID=3155462 RepID=UPI0033DD2314
MPDFPPVRVRGGTHRLRRALRGRRGAVAAGLAVVAATMAATGARDALGTGGSSAPDSGARGAPRPPAAAAPPPRLVTAPVRIADAATVGLLRPGDRVDVIATPSVPGGPGGFGDGPGPEGAAASGGAGQARVVASGVRVAAVPRIQETFGDGPEGGALVVLSVPRSTATALAGAAATSRLAVTVC